MRDEALFLNGGLYNASQAAGGQSINLLHIRRPRKLKTGFCVCGLVKVIGGDPVSPGRTTAGGWVYVRPVDLATLE